jgi:hypothetical protein
MSLFQGDSPLIKYPDGELLKHFLRIFSFLDVFLVLLFLLLLKRSE